MTLLARYDSLVQQSLDQPGEDVRDDLLALITKTHFLLLKVNFEFFLNRLTHAVWDCHFRELIQRKKLLSERFRLEEFATAVLHEAAKEYVLDKVVPTHGLDRFVTVLAESTGIDIQHAVASADARAWSQIHSAFEVRHLIEHTNGKVDREFWNTVVTQPLWRNSSWGGQKIDLGTKVEIRDQDFDQTFAAMVAATDIIAEQLKGFDATRR